MTLPNHYLSPTQAARRLGVSAKALRLYERRGLIEPGRNAAGWRVYAPEDMAQAAAVVALRRLGLDLTAIDGLLSGAKGDREMLLSAHQAVLENRIRDLANALGRLHGLRTQLAREARMAAGASDPVPPQRRLPSLVFDLPWPWGGERFELKDMRALTYIVGPLGCGKTRLARRLADVVPGAAFLGLDRVEAASGIRRHLAAEPRLQARVRRAMDDLVQAGAFETDALTGTVAGLEAEGPAVLVVDMTEQGLDHDSQTALIAHLRRQATVGRPLFLLTRSSAILDLAALGPDEAVLFCPANHSPPSFVAPHPGAAGYEAVATCLATPSVRARTEGIVAWRPGSPPSQ